MKESEGLTRQNVAIDEKANGQSVGVSRRADGTGQSSPASREGDHLNMSAEGQHADVGGH
jgi:hypothetical protein